MIPKIFVVALSCVLIVQIHPIHGQDPKSQSTARPETASQNELANPIANKTVNIILRHFRITMTHPESAEFIRHFASSLRITFTDETGQLNVKHLVNFFVNTLMDSNTLDTVKILRQRLVQLADSDRSVPVTLETAAVTTRKLLDEPKVMAALEGLIEGINLLLDGMNEQKLLEGIGRVKNLQKLASFFTSNIKIPPNQEKLRKTQSDAQVSYQSPVGKGNMQLVSRGYDFHDDYGWINKEPQIQTSSKDKDNKNSKGEFQLESRDVHNDEHVPSAPAV